MNTEPADPKRLGLTGDASRGKKLFKQNCAACHLLSDKRITGPGLKGILDRVPKPAEEYLTKYILNTEKLRIAGDGYANKLQKENPGVSMPVFEGALSEDQARDIIAYVCSSPL